MELRTYVDVPALYEYLINHVFSFCDMKKILSLIESDE